MRVATRTWTRRGSSDEDEDGDNNNEEDMGEDGHGTDRRCVSCVDAPRFKESSYSGYGVELCLVEVLHMGSRNQKLDLFVFMLI